MAVEKTEFTVSNKTVLRVLALVVVVVLGVRAVQLLAHPITLILISFFLACALNPAVHWISSHINRSEKGSRTMATAIAFISVILVLVGFFALVIPPLVNQVSEFIDNVPETIQSVKTQDSAIGRAVRTYKFDEQIDSFAHDFGSQISAKPILSTASRVGETLVSTLAVLAMTFMMLNEAPSWLNRIWALQPESKRAHRKDLTVRMYGMVTGYVNGQLIMATIAGFAALVMLVVSSSILDVSINAVALAGIIAIFGLIPLIGNPIGALVVVLACLLASSNLAIVMAIYFLVYGQIENVTLQPYIQSKQNELTPLTVFVSALLGISFGGILGALFAIPFAGCLRILAMDWAERSGYVKHSAKKAA